MVDSLPDLDKIISKCNLMALSSNNKQSAEAFCSALALLCHLKGEHEYIRVSAQESPEEIPSPTKLPAMTSILQDDKLFQTLLRCLQTTTAMESIVQQDHLVNGRKRSMSVTNEQPPSKQMKISSGGGKKHHIENSQDVFWPGVACAVLACALDRLDHWPACLVHVYAQDSFGPRTWVDRTECKCLVDNLLLCHGTETRASESENAIEAATHVADAYRGYPYHDTANNVGFGEGDHPRSPKRRGSISSAGSFRPCIQETPLSAESSKKVTAEDSDSGEEQDMIVTVSGMGDDSSSGGDDEEMVVDTNLLSGRQGATNHNPKVEKLRTSVGRYPFHVQAKILNTGIRGRFIGPNCELAHELIGRALANRLETKSKQNSSLLQALPSFTQIPCVRKLIASNLERWLQSPALAGLARQLFSNTVQHLENREPPLPDDLETIDCILNMKLKTNQLNAHIENITAIATKMPSVIVINRMYAKLLKESVEEFHQHAGMSKQPSDHLSMVAAIHRHVPAQLSYDAMAASLLSMLVTLDNEEGKERLQRERVVRRLRALIRAVAGHLGHEFDAYFLMESLLSFDIDVESWSAKDEESKARLLFQCVTLCVSRITDTTRSNSTGRSVQKPVSTEEEESLKERLKSSRRALLQWCCAEYGSRCRLKVDRKNGSGRGKNGEVIGAGTPDFRSILHDKEVKIPSWLRIMRCLLFIEDPDSAFMRQFVCPGESPEIEEDWNTELGRIRVCAQYGVDVDDEMLWIVIKSSAGNSKGLSPEMTVQLLENLLECCTATRHGNFSVSDPMLLWEMYAISEYHPPKNLRPDYDNSERSDVPPNIPKLAYPSLWWRINVLVLIMCAASPDKIGRVVWAELPTLRSLLKIVTSQEYEFPPVDCNLEMRMKMKSDEQAARDEEIRVAEILFLPKRHIQSKSTPKQVGSRVSTRILKQRRERAAAQEQAETNRRRELLRTGQRSIMLWDPDGAARKPPKELGHFLLTVEREFCMSATFQQSQAPDFVLQTIGETSRDAIERAHRWLIPIISKFPSTIERLPSNATCFLLLRSYGHSGDTAGSQLKSLSTPLLEHVKASLFGQFGQANATEALDLLLGDIASSDQNRRRCARKVLNDTLSDDSSNSSSWITGVLRLDHSESLVPCTIKHMSIAAEFERGDTLASLVMGLHEHITFAESRGLAVQSNFAALLLRLISRRPSVYSELMFASLDFRKLAVEILYSEFLRFIKQESNPHDQVELTLFETPLGGGKVRLPKALLQSTCVLLSVWVEQSTDALTDDKATGEKVHTLLNSLLMPDNNDSDFLEPDKGLCTGRFPDSGKDAMRVESWIILSKSRDTMIARRAALSAPIEFLPRLLLCSGLPQTPLITMLARLDRAGDSTTEKFGKLLASSPPSSEWDIGRVGNRRDFAKKLALRLRAYSRLYKLQDGGVFADWLDTEAKSEKAGKSKRSKLKKSRIQLPQSLCSMEGLSSILGKIESGQVAETEDLPVDKELQIPELQFPQQQLETATGTENVRALIERHATASRLHLLDKALVTKLDTNEARAYAIGMLQVFDSKLHSTMTHARFLQKWIPLLTDQGGDEDLWTLLFTQTKECAKAMADGMLTVIIRCANVWGRSVTKSCTSWLLRLDDVSLLCAERAAAFLTEVSGAYMSCTNEFHGTESLNLDLTGKCMSNALKFALASYQSTTSGLSRIDTVSTPIHLLLAIAGCRKEHLQAIVEKICSMASSTAGSAMQTLLLRLYFASPLWMSLGSPMIRNGLISASQLHHASWLLWPSSLDSQLDGILTGLFRGETKLARALSDLTRKHPLLLFRKSKSIVSHLCRDGDHLATRTENVRGLIVGSIALPATVSKKEIRAHIRIRQWGCSFTEPVWIVLLDVFSSIPRELLLGPNLGLYDILSIYVQLISVQLMYVSSREKISRLRAKLNDCFGALKQGKNWKEWLATSIDGEKVRNVLVSCQFLSADEAIESIR